VSTDSPARRRNRDQFAQTKASQVSPTVPHALAADALARDRAWLRFPAELEAHFQAAALEPRRKLMIPCGFIGILAICLGSLDLRALMPDAPEVAFRNLYLILGAVLVAHVMVVFMPRPWRRHWHVEAMSATSLLSVNAGVIHDCMVTRADTMFTHSAALVSTLMFGCIAARMRFQWSLACAITSFVAYVSLVQGHTPQQVLIVEATIGLMVVSYAFALIANYSFEHRERRNWLLRKLEGQQRDELRRTSERLHIASIQDPLTGLFNRRQFDNDLGMAWSKAMFAREPLALLMVDVDFFKRYNDSHGHPAGDACLVKIGQALSDMAREHGGIAARLGGEEFGLLLPGHELVQAVAVGDALCERVRAAAIPHRDSSVSAHVTVSVGAAQAWPGAGAEQTLLTLADQALYDAKSTGRDRVCAVPAPERAAQREPVAPPTAAPVEPAQSADLRALPALPESAYTQILKGRFRRLRFPKEQEAHFINQDVDQRRKFLVSMAVVGLLIYNVYMLCNRSMFADIQDSAVRFQIGLGMAMLLLTLVAYAVPMPVLWREGLFSLGTAVMGIASSWLLSQSQELTALAFSVSLVLIPMFSGVAARQPFWFTCIPAVVTCVAVALFLQPSGAQQTLVFTDSVTMIVTNTVFTLILSYTLDHGTRKEWLLSQVERLQGEALSAATRRLHDLSMLDPLTGIGNRRQFEDNLQRLWEDGLAKRQPLSMLIIDVDFFKLYNDGYGHPGGDRCLKQVAAALNETARAGQGLTARLGGEEFGVLLPGADQAQALALGERLCAAIRALGVEHRHSRVPDVPVVTVSVGAACLMPTPQLSRHALLSLADDALYQAKHAGRNRAMALEGTPAARNQPVAVSS